MTSNRASKLLGRRGRFHDKLLLPLDTSAMGRALRHRVTAQDGGCRYCSGGSISSMSFAPNDRMDGRPVKVRPARMSARGLTSQAAFADDEDFNGAYDAARDQSTLERRHRARAVGERETAPIPRAEKGLSPASRAYRTCADRPVRFHRPVPFRHSCRPSCPLPGRMVRRRITSPETELRPEVNNRRNCWRQ